MAAVPPIRAASVDRGRDIVVTAADCELTASIIGEAPRF
jgi:hypothetical protein